MFTFALFTTYQQVSDEYAHEDDARKIAFLDARKSPFISQCHVQNRDDNQLHAVCDHEQAEYAADDPLEPATRHPGATPIHLPFWSMLSASDSSNQPCFLAEFMQYGGIE